MLYQYAQMKSRLRRPCCRTDRHEVVLKCPNQKFAVQRGPARAKICRVPIDTNCQKRKEMTYRAVGSLHRPANLQTEAAKGQQEEEPAALCFLRLLLTLPVVVVQRRHGLLEERVDFPRHPSGLYEGRVLLDLVDEVYVGSAFGVGAAAARGVAAKGDEFWAGSGSLRSACIESRRVSRGRERGARG
jgi:hypothetical protein